MVLDSKIYKLDTSWDSNYIRSSVYHQALTTRSFITCRIKKLNEHYIRIVLGEFHNPCCCDN